MVVFQWYKLILLSVVCSLTYADEDILCKQKTCDDVLCPTTSDYCEIGNSTHNGIYLPSPSKCNCCKFCAEYLLEGDACTTGSVDSPTPESLCGPGLSCNCDDTKKCYCGRIQSACTDQQAYYDNRTDINSIGSMELRPICDGDGDYASYSCIPGQICYCVRQNGKRIFGTIDYTGTPAFDLQCDCSRKYLDAVDIHGRELHPNEFFRCQANGDYDEVQCINNRCFCVNPIDGSPIDSDKKTVNVTEVSIDDSKYVGSQYYKPCELEYFLKQEEYEQLQSDGYDMAFPYILPNCDIDGTYGPVQQNVTHKYCTDIDGNILLPAISKMEEPELAENMNCNCVRESVITSSTDKPQCASNGNYLPYQCRRGVCRCVDAEGNQDCKNFSPCEIDKENLNQLGCATSPTTPGSTTTILQ